MKWPLWSDLSLLQKDTLCVEQIEKRDSNQEILNWIYDKSVVLCELRQNQIFFVYQNKWPEKWAQNSSDKLQEDSK